MMVHDVSTYLAFIAGIVSFLSPCVLPLVPGYVSFMSGVSLREIQTDQTGSFFLTRQHRAVMYNSIFFILGFSTVFVLLGASATWIGTFLANKITIFSKVAGLVVVFLGLVKLGVVRPLLLLKEFSLPVDKVKAGIFGASLLGAAFAFGWTPCIGPVLGGILAFSGTLDHVNQGIWLLSVYSLGLGIPFFLTALCLQHFFSFFSQIKNHLNLVEKLTGLLLVAMGVLIFSDSLALIQSYIPFLNRFAM